jgi:hypothetical protein
MVNKSVGSKTRKTAVITGGSRGLGRNTSLNLATRGVRERHDKEGKNEPPRVGRRDIYITHVVDNIERDTSNVGCE